MLAGLFLLAGLAALLPNAAELGGAVPGQRRVYGSDLYQYIDGGAESYHAYGMAAMIHQEYRLKDTDLTADIYDMGDPLSAFGIYSAERSPDYRFLRIGADAYGEDTTLNFLQGRFYVKLSAFRDGGASAAGLLETCAAAISRRIGGGKSLPEGLKLLPTANRVPRSEKYIKKAPLGYDFLAPAWAATYTFGGRPTTVAVAVRANPAEAEALSRRLAGKEILFFVRGRYLVVIVDPPPDPAGLIEALKGAVPGAD